MVNRFGGGVNAITAVNSEVNPSITTLESQQYTKLIHYTGFN